MALSLETFKKIIEQHQAANRKTNEAALIGIHIDFFDVFFAIEETLLDEVMYSNYIKEGVDDVLYEWMYNNNTTPIIIEDDKYPIKTIEDVYNVLEKFYKLKN